MGVSTLMCGKQPGSQVFKAVAKYPRKTAEETKWLVWLLVSRDLVCLIVFQVCGEAKKLRVEYCNKGGKLSHPP